MSAADTGLVYATRTLTQQSSRFVVEKGVIDVDYAEELWLGTYDQGADGPVIVLPADGFTESTPPDGVVHAMANAHAACSHNLTISGDVTEPQIDETYGTLHVPPIALQADEDGVPMDNGPFFRLKYELLDSAQPEDPDIRVTSQGVDGDITRTLQMDFHIEKKIEYSVISPNRIMIGKNVRVEGPLGSRYGLVEGELDTTNGDPLVMRSDFYYLDDTLNDTLDTFFSRLYEYDVDGDGRLRPDHPVEKLGMTGYSELIDYDGDEFVDDFDLFLAHFDSNSNQAVVYDSTLAADAGLGSLSEEFAGVDDQLARLIDWAFADRDGDGEVTTADRQLGYMDGVIDAKDLYAKVTGRLMFAIQREPWDAANGASYQTVVNGPVRPGLDNAPVEFEADEKYLREIDTSMFVDSQTWFDNHTASSQAFGDESSGQVADNLDAGVGTYTASGDDTWESVPFGSTGAYDHFQRPVYDGMTFEDLRIPKGTNPLFVDCTFIGITYIETQQDVDHENWNYAGSREPVETDTDGDGTPDTTVYELRFPGLDAELDGSPVIDTRVESNNIRFHNCTFLGSLAGDTPNEYTHWRNKVQMTGNTRFYIDVEDEDLADQDDAATLIGLLEGLSEEEVEESKKSSIMLPGWSVDVGNFTNEVAADPTDTPKVLDSYPEKYRNSWVYEELYVRGTADIHGTLMLTHRPTANAGPLFYGGLPDAFNTTIGYFGPSDGDSEGVDTADADFDGFGEITLRYNEDALLPDGIPWPIRIKARPVTYIEGGEM